MSAPHVIRLRGPWESEPVADAPLPTILWKRRFGRPTGLESGEQLCLCLRSTSQVQRATLNDAELHREIDASATHRIDITSRVRERNLLELTLDATASQPEPGTPFEVWLEISPPGR